MKLNRVTKRAAKVFFSIGMLAGSIAFAMTALRAVFLIAIAVE